MGFWTFGGGKKQDGSHAKSDNISQLEKARADTYMASRQNAASQRDLTTGTMSRSQTAPVLTESKSAQNVRSGGRQKGNEFYQQAPTSQASLDRENLPAFSGPPTLFAKRSGQDAQGPRPRSAKRKIDDYAREREIRAMASSPIPIPKRPANFRSESPLLRETKQVPAGLKRQSSEISLPMPGALSNIDFTSSQNSFKIGLLAALSPRPNIQYDTQARTPSGKQPARAGLAVQKAIEEEDVSELKRIDELADDLDAPALRELMERDRKRREKKREADKERLLRKLERRALKDREEETRRARTEAFVRESSPANAERRRTRKTEPSGSRSHKNVKKSTTQKQTPKEPTVEKEGTEQMREQRSQTKSDNPFTDEAAVTSKADAQPVAETREPPIPKAKAPAPIRNPFEDEADTEITPGTEAALAASSYVDIPPRSALRPSGEKVELGSNGPQDVVAAQGDTAHQSGGRSSLSQRSISALSRSKRSDKSEDLGQEKKSSGTNNVRLSTWTNFFSTGTRRKLTTPTGTTKPEPNFTAVSRESEQRKALPPVVTERTFSRSSSGTPQRQLSRFREDLPEHPSSQTTSAVQSPVSVNSPLRILDVSQQRIRSDENEDTYSIQPSIDIESRPTSTSAAPLPQSMASVDSEGSWLSGRPSKRVSATSGPGSTTQRSQKTLTGDSPAQDGSGETVDNDHFNPLSSNPVERQPSGPSAQRGTVDTLEEPERDSGAVTPELPPKSEKRQSVHADARRRPTIVNQEDRIKSQAGLLNDAEAGAEKKEPEPEDENADDNDGESPGSVEIVDEPLLRAQSVGYKGHARAVSAGSAKLLDIRRISTHSDLSRPRSPTLARKSTLGIEQPDESGAGTPTTTD